MRGWIKFCKADESLEDEECSGQPLEADNNNREQSVKLILLQLHEKLPKNSTSTILWSFGIWSKLEKWKSSVNWCLMNWPQSKEIIVLKCHLLLFYATTMNHFSIRIVMCNKKCEVWWFLRQLVMTSSVTGPRRSSKVLPQAKLAPKKCHRSCLVVCCWSDPLQPSESQWNHYIWEVCSTYWWDVLKIAMPAASTGQQNGPNSSPRQHPTARRTTNTSKVEQIGLWSFASSAIFTWLLTNWPPLLQAYWQLFVDKMFPQPIGGRKCFPRTHPGGEGYLYHHWLSPWGTFIPSC